MSGTFSKPPPIPMLPERNPEPTVAAVTLVFRLKAGEQGKTFGSVTAKEVAEALKKEVRTEIDKTKVVLREPLRSLGVHKVEVRLLADVRADVTVAIEPA